MTCRIQRGPRRLPFNNTAPDPARVQNPTYFRFIVTRYDYRLFVAYDAACAARRDLAARHPKRKFTLVKCLNEAGDGLEYFVTNRTYRQARTLAMALLWRSRGGDTDEARDGARIRTVIHARGEPSPEDIAAARAFRQEQIREAASE